MDADDQYKNKLRLLFLWTARRRVTNLDKENEEQAEQ
jgi:hypothetical protein